MTPADAIAIVPPIVSPIRKPARKQGFFEGLTPKKPAEYVVLGIASTLLFSSLFCGATAVYVTRSSAASTSPAPIVRTAQGSKPSYAAPVAAYTTNASAPVKQTLAQSKRWYVGPASVRGTLGGQTIDERILHGSGTHTYTLGANDSLDLVLPAASTPQQTVGFQGYAINGKQRIDYTTLSRLPLNAAGERVLDVKGAVRLLDKNTQTPLSAYRISLRFKAAAQPSTYAEIAAARLSQAPAPSITISDAKGTYRIDAKQRAIPAGSYVGEDRQKRDKPF